MGILQQHFQYIFTFFSCKPDSMTSIWVQKSDPNNISDKIFPTGQRSHWLVQAKIVGVMWFIMLL